MALKRASPLEEPPSASSSSEEEEETSSEAGSSSEDDDQPPKLTQPLSTEKKPATKTPPPAAPIAKSQPKASVSESETESDTGSDSDDERPGENTDLVVKPIGAKPKEETPKAQKSKSKSQPLVSPAKSLKSANKRPSDNNRPVSDLKKAKKGKDAAGTDEAPAAEDDGKKAGDESKKLFQRLWNEDDGITILSGLAEYAAKTGEAPLKDINGFHDFIKKSVHVDVSKEQLANKIRTLKRKYVKNAQRGENGEGPYFSKPYDKRVFELSRKIWADEGANGGIDITKSNGKVKKKNTKEGSSFAASQKLVADLVSDSKEARKVDIDRNAGSPLSLSEMIRFNKGLDLSGLDDDIIKRGYELIGASKKAELEDRWKKLKIAELELFVKRVELVKDEASLIWEATKSSGN